MRVENTDIADQGDDNNNTDVVKSGDLTVTAKASTDRKIIVGENGGVSDTDTLTFKTSENVEITKITLERYGFSDGSEVVSGVRLEDADGNIIADAKELNSKDQVTLSIKKDYRKVDGTFTATIVVETADGSETAAGGTMWFKVTDVQSTAKNLNLDDYKPYNYDLVVYNGTKVELSRYGNDKDYNYEAGEMYEVARFRLKANNSAIIVNGFTLTNNATKKVDLEKNLDKVEVIANGEKVSAKYSVNKDDQLVITLSNEYELAAKKAVSFVVNASLTDFEDYGYGVKFELAANDLKAIEKKTETRVTVDADDAEWAEHTFRGGKIKLTNTKLGNVDAAAGSVSVVVAEWDITVGESIRVNDFTVTASADVIDAMTLVVAGEEYDGKDNKDGTFTFSKVIIEKSGKVQFKVDLDDEINTEIVKEVKFTIDGKSSFDKAVLAGSKYEELKNQYVAEKDVSWSVTFSTLKPQAAKASLENTLSKSKAIEFIADKWDRKVVFDGTYTAKKGDVSLNTFRFEWDENVLDDYVTFYVFIDGEEVGSVDTFSEWKSSIETFSDVKVKKDATVKVKVEAEVSSDIQNETTYPTKATYELYLQWEDSDGNEVGKWNDSISPISVKDSGSVVIPSWNEGNTVKLRASGETIAYFVVKPSNGTEGIYLDTLELEITGKVDGADVTASDIKVNIGDDKNVDVEEGNTLTYKPNTELPKEGVVVEVILKGEASGEYEVAVDVNNGSATETFNRKFVDALVRVTKQENKTSFTKYTLSVEKYDDTVKVENFDMFDKEGSVLATPKANVSDGNTVEADNVDGSRTIISMSYDIDGETVTLDRAVYEDFFVDNNGDTLRVFSNK